MNSYPIASELSYLVLKKQRRDGEITLPPAHQSHQVETTLYSKIAGLKAIDGAVDLNDTGDELRLHGKR